MPETPPPGYVPAMINGREVKRTWNMVAAIYGTTCHICGEAGATTIDHVIPRSKGGRDNLENLRPAHHRCNSSRQDKPIPPRPVQPSSTSREW